MKVRTHKTKIICTIGPASHRLETMKQMIEAGMDVARLNFSHGSYDDHARVIGELRAASGLSGRPLTIMADLPGPKLRIGQLAREPLELESGDSLILTTGDSKGEAGKIPVAFPRLPEVVKIGDIVYLNDGFIQLQVTAIREQDVICTVLVGGELRSRKGLNLPGLDLGIKAFTQQDSLWLRFASEQGLDAVSQSFVEDASDIEDLRRAADGLGYHPFIIAKIERAGALRQIEAILEAADGIMIARGDLGVETPIEEIALVQKDLTRRANRIGKPIITATQMLRTMTDSRRPTRAEATDVANAVLDGTDCVMLSEESSIGKYPVEATAMLGKIAAAAETRRPLKRVEEIFGQPDPSEIWLPVHLINRSAETCLRYGRFAAVFVPTHSGASARSLARFRLPVWVVGISRFPATCRQLQFSYGVFPIYKPEDTEDWKGFIKTWLNSQGLNGNLALLTEGPSSKHPEINHRLEIVEI
ncbi:MAG: pyruvate kinase [Thermodesulfobacteriota bacterium]